jgi:hypothetical protein
MAERSQGSPLSPILYLFYNADLLENCAMDGVLSSGWVDDVSLMATESDKCGHMGQKARTSL